jgi:DNA-binding response OmpR family regulator
MILYNEPFVTYYVREAEMSVQMNIKRQPVIQRRYLTIDLQCCTVILSGEQITLYPKEFDVLYLLAQYPGWVLSPEQIYGAVWKECVAGCEHVVYNVICQLRKKLKNPDLIQTVVGRGYRFVE